MLCTSVSRGFGDKELKEEGLVTCTPDVVALRLTEELRFMLIACDGVWDVLSDQVSTSVLRQDEKERPRGVRFSSVFLRFFCAEWFFGLARTGFLVLQVILHSLLGSRLYICLDTNVFLLQTPLPVQILLVVWLDTKATNKSGPPYVCGRGVVKRGPLSLV